MFANGYPIILKSIPSNEDTLENVYKELEGLGLLKILFIVMGEKNADKDTSYNISELGFSLRDKEKLDTLAENLNVKEVQYVDLFEVVERVLPSESVLIVPESGVSSLFYVRLGNSLDTYRVTGSFSDHLKELMVSHGKLSVFSLNTLYKNIKVSSLIEEGRDYTNKLRLLWDSFNLRIPQIPIIEDKEEEVYEDVKEPTRSRFKFPSFFRKRKKESLVSEGADAYRELSEVEVVNLEPEEEQVKADIPKVKEQDGPVADVPRSTPKPVVTKKEQMVLMEDIWELDDRSSDYEEDEEEITSIVQDKQEKGFSLQGLVLLIISAVVFSIGAYFLNHKESESLQNYIKNSIIFMEPKLQPEKFNSLMNNVKIIKSLGVENLVYENEGNTEIMTFSAPSNLSVEKLNEGLALIPDKIISAETFLGDENVQMFKITISKFELTYP